MSASARSAGTRRLGRWWRRVLASARGRSPKVAWGRCYGVELPTSTFDPNRAERILGFLLDEGLVARREVHRVAREAPLSMLMAVHTEGYLESLQTRGSLTGILGFDVDDGQQDLYLESQRQQVAGTAWAATTALADNGIALNLGGGFHHALADRGQGFCAYNDVAVAIAAARRRGFADRVLVVDLDLHDGDGTREIFARDPTVHTLSIHNRHLSSTSAIESTSIALGSGVEDEPYLAAVRGAIPDVLRAFSPRLAFYLAGADPAADDRLGDWRISAEGLIARDRFVVACLRRRSRPVPTVVLLAGGYGSEAWRHGARLASAIVGTGRPVEPPTTAHLRLRHYRRIALAMSPGELTHDPAADWQLTDEDVDPRASRARSSRFLDYYSRHGLELALERTGLLDALRRRGHRQVRLELDVTAGEEHTLRLCSVAAGGESVIELRLHRETRAIPGMTLLWIDWLLLQDPLAGFTPQRPALPGQRHPGLGLLGDVSAVLVLMCERLELDGMGFVPSHFHIAARARSHFRFIDPAAQGGFASLRRGLADLTLGEATEALEAGKVRDRKTGRTLSWEPSPMVYAVSDRLRAILDDPSWAESAARIEAEIEPVVVP